MFPLGRTKKSHSIRLYLLEAIKNGKPDYIQNAVSSFGISRQAVHRHLLHLVNQNYLTAEGSTRARKYSLGAHRWHQASYDLIDADEAVAYRESSFVFQGLPVGVEEICHYGFTEMFNNAIDHSEGKKIEVIAERNGNKISILIKDDGEGIFTRISRLLKLSDPRESLLELGKGKLTTDPDNHTGEGIFFTSRVFDDYSIFSGDLAFHHIDSMSHDFLMHDANDRKGTAVLMEINTTSEKNLGEVFDEYSSGPDEYRFDKTVVPVRLALYEGERLVSRSQAKRIMNRVEKFKHVILDFEGVDSVGQAFADEVFRVYKNNHPNIELSHMNANEQVNKMIRRAESA